MELSSAERYNPLTNSWSPIVAMNSRRSGVSLQEIFSPTAGAEVYYSFEKGSLTIFQRLGWTCNSKWTITCSWRLVIVLKLFEVPIHSQLCFANLISGFDGATYLKTIEVYDPDTNQWKPCGSMNYRRLGGGVGVMKIPATESALW